METEYEGIVNRWFVVPGVEKEVDGAAAPVSSAGVGCKINGSYRTSIINNEQMKGWKLQFFLAGNIMV